MRQAISLYVARESGAYHASDFDLDFVRNPLTVPYDAAAIEDCLQRILHDEVWFERLLSQQKIVPLRLTYEQLQAGAAAVIDRIASHLGVSRVAIADTDRTGRPVTHRDANEWEDRFRKSHTQTLAGLDRGRPPLRTALQE